MERAWRPPPHQRARHIIRERNANGARRIRSPRKLKSALRPLRRRNPIERGHGATQGTRTRGSSILLSICAICGPGQRAGGGAACLVRKYGIDKGDLSARLGSSVARAHCVRGCCIAEGSSVRSATSASHLPGVTEPRPRLGALHLFIRSSSNTMSDIKHAHASVRILHRRLRRSKTLARRSHAQRRGTSFPSRP